MKTKKKSNKPVMKRSDRTREFLMFADALLRESFASRLTIIRDPKGVITYLENLENRTVREVSMERLVDIATKAFNKKDLICKTAHTKEAIDYYINSIQAELTIPASIAQLNSEGLAFNRLGFEPQSIETPLFDEILSRCTNADALKAFIWSIFEPSANKQQYLWLYGEGGNGKSTLAGFLEKIMGDAYCSERATGAANNKHYTASFVGKRLAVYSDTNSLGFVRSELFKELSGNDVIKVERKYESPFTIRLDVKFLFLSNSLPQISSQKSDQRRAIICELGPIAGDIDPMYEEKLWSERAGILFKCREQYYLSTSSHGPIRCNVLISEDLAEDTEVGFQVVFDSCFTLCYDSEMSPEEMYRTALPFCQNYRIQYSDFKKWLDRKLKLKITRKAGIGPRVVHGIKVKESIYPPQPTSQRKDLYEFR